MWHHCGFRFPGLNIFSKGFELVEPPRPITFYVQPPAGTNGWSGEDVLLNFRFQHGRQQLLQETNSNSSTVCRRFFQVTLQCPADWGNMFGPILNLMSYAVIVNGTVLVKDDGSCHGYLEFGDWLVFTDDASLLLQRDCGPVVLFDLSPWTTSQDYCNMDFSYCPIGNPRTVGGNCLHTQGVVHTLANNHLSEIQQGLVRNMFANSPFRWMGRLFQQTLRFTSPVAKIVDDTLAGYPASLRIALHVRHQRGMAFKGKKEDITQTDNDALACTTHHIIQHKKHGQGCVLLSASDREATIQSVRHGVAGLCDVISLPKHVQTYGGSFEHGDWTGLPALQDLYMLSKGNYGRAHFRFGQQNFSLQLRTQPRST